MSALLLFLLQILLAVIFGLVAVGTLRSVYNIATGGDQ